MKYTLRDNLPPMPERMKTLAVSDKGYPVPYFVAWINGKPDFRVIDPRRAQACVDHQRCWICGEQLGRNLAFVVGPMCSINRISGEPPSHRDCAEFAIQACPFLILPKAQRREAGLEDTPKHMKPGHFAHNPGVALVWITEDYEILEMDGASYFVMGQPSEAAWYTEGRPATHAEALQALKEGAARLVDQFKPGDQDAIDLLKRRYGIALQFLPAENVNAN